METDKDISKSSSSIQKKQLIPIIIAIGCFILLYYDTIAGMMEDWNTNDSYSHGYLIPFITAYIIWKDKKNLASIPVEPAKAGLFCVMGSLIFFVVANIGAELFTMRFSMILVILSVVYFLAGAKILKRVYIPILYLVFMIPFPAIIWNRIAFPLKLFATHVAVMVIRLINIPVYNEGNIIHLSNTVLEVVDACSGLRSLVSLLALSAAFAIISTELSKFKKLILFLSAIPIAISLNIFRLSSTAVLAKYYGPEVAQGFLHDVSGMIVFVIALIILILINNLLSWKKTKT